MVENPLDTCVVCQKHRGLVPLAGGAIHEDDLIFVSHAQLWDEETKHYLGHLFVETRRHVAEIGDLFGDEAQRIGLYVSRSARALMLTLGVEHVYSFVIGDGIPHVHVHVIGRYSGAPRKFWGPKVDEWPDAPHGDDQAIEQVAERIRNFLLEEYANDRRESTQ